MKYTFISNTFVLPGCIVSLWIWRTQNGVNKMEKWINLPPKKAKGRGKGLQRKEANCHTWIFLVKRQQSHGEPEGFLMHLPWKQPRRKLQRPGVTPEHAGSRVVREMWPSKANTPSPHTSSCCWALASVATWEWTTPSLFLCLCHSYFQASPPRASHSLAAHGHPGGCFLRCVYSVIKGNDSRSFRRYLSTRRETWVASQ